MSTCLIYITALLFNYNIVMPINGQKLNDIANDSLYNENNIPGIKNYNSPGLSDPIIGASGIKQPTIEYGKIPNGNTVPILDNKTERLNQFWRDPSGNSYNASYQNETTSNTDQWRSNEKSAFINFLSKNWKLILFASIIILLFLLLSYSLRKVNTGYDITRNRKLETFILKMAPYLIVLQFVIIAIINNEMPDSIFKFVLYAIPVASIGISTIITKLGMKNKSVGDNYLAHFIGFLLSIICPIALLYIFNYISFREVENLANLNLYDLFKHAFLNIEIFKFKLFIFACTIGIFYLLAKKLYNYIKRRSYTFI